MIERVPPKKMALQVARILRKQRPDAGYLKEVFQNVRLELGLRGSDSKAKKLPEILTDQEMVRFYEAVWNAMDRNPCGHDQTPDFYRHPKFRVGEPHTGECGPQWVED